MVKNSWAHELTHKLQTPVFSWTPDLPCWHSVDLVPSVVHQTEAMTAVCVWQHNDWRLMHDDAIGQLLVVDLELLVQLGEVCLGLSLQWSDAQVLIKQATTLEQNNGLFYYKHQANYASGYYFINSTSKLTARDESWSHSQSCFCT